jgi:transposase-like protein
METVLVRSCPHCHGSRIISYGAYPTRVGSRRRFRCKECDRTFSDTNGELHYRAQSDRETLDLARALHAGGHSKASIARRLGVSWNTVARWVVK